MKKITLTLAAFALVFTAFAQDVVIERPADNTTALITTNGSDDAGVFCADFFTLEEDTTLGSFTFPGFYSSAVEIGDLLTGADLYIYQDLNGSPNANPTTANALVNLTSVQLGAGLELRLVDNIESGFIINVTAANGGSQITLPAGDYWVAFAPAVVGGSAGAGRWNWNGSFTTQTGIFPANESLLIDSDNLFGAGATDWTGISSLIGADFPSFAWILTSEGTTTGGTTFITCADDVFNDTYCYTNNDTTDKVYTSDTGLPLRLTFTGGTVELNFDEVIILDSDGVTNLNTGNPYGNNGDMTGFVFESSGDTLTLRVNSDGSESCENGSGSFVPLIYDISCLPPPGSDIIVRPSNGGTALISTHGNEDLGVYCADFFTLNEPIVLDNFTFDGYTSSNGPIASLLLGAELYIYQDAGANPDGNPTAGNAFVNLTNIQQNAGLELLTDEGGSTIFQINVTAANGGNPIILPAGSYWVAFAPFVQGTSAGAGRWNWNGSSITPANQPVLIDPGDIFGAAATNWTNISSLIGQDFTSLAWTLTEGEPTTPCQSTPAITNPINDLVVCETGSSTVPSGIFDLTDMDAEILNTLVNVSLTYHLSLADAETGQSPIASPFETQSTTIWVRATDDTTSNPVCYSVGVFDLIVEPIPDFSPTTLITIADDEIVDGITQFNLNSYIPEITLGNPDLTVTFHLTGSDAQNGVGNLPGLYTNISNPQIIHARVSDNITACYGIGVIELSVMPPPPNNLCENASELSCGMSVQGYDTSFATNTNAPDACGTSLDTAPGVWHTLTIPTDGDYNVSVDTFGSVFDTKLGVFSGNCNDLICIGGNDDSGGTAQSKVLFTGAAAQTYYIYVTGFNTSSGEYDINISCVLIPPLPPENDLCENASVIDCGSQSQGDTSFATNTNAPSACETDLDTAPGVWYTLPLPTDGDYNVSVDTFGSGFDTKLGVFSGECNQLVCIGGNDDFGGTAQSKVLFTGDGAQTYYIYVTGFGSSSGDYTLNISCEDVLDITENDFVDINMYPNPASDKVTISNTGLLELETISVYDLKGRLMIKNNIEGIESITIDTSILQSATYMIVIESKYRNIIKRLLIE
ncbi:T9SS type A sorting domain-containing protein [Flavobacteriaceae bacterium]|nr:T9SS type A sorting domain-containing protein [Flavobacteriaceae bacterium]